MTTLATGLKATLKATSTLVALAALLTACVPPPMGPSVQALQGPGKSFAEFQQDNSICMGNAQASIAAAQQQANQQQAGATLAPALLSAFATAAVGGNGRDTAAAFAGGLQQGAYNGADSAAQSAATLQQRYDISFTGCMVARGEIIPGAMPVVATYQQRVPVSDPLVRSIQGELVRIGYLRGGVDGVYGQMTRTAILTFEGANGMAADASPTTSLLSRLRTAPSGSGVVASAGMVAPERGSPVQPGSPSSGMVSPGMVSPGGATASAPPAPPSSGMVSPGSQGPITPVAASGGMVSPGAPGSAINRP